MEQNDKNLAILLLMADALYAVFYLMLLAIALAVAVDYMIEWN